MSSSEFADWADYYAWEAKERERQQRNAEMRSQVRR